MRAWRIERIGEPDEAIALAETVAPEPAPGEVAIRVEAAGLGLPDVFMCRGTYAFRPELPAVPGQEVCGIVTRAGDGARTPVGTRVSAVTSFFRSCGGLADQTVALDAATYPVPDDLPAADAAAFAIPYHTAWLALVDRGGLRRDETLLVLGAAGGSGSAAVALGRALGARVIASASGPEKAAWCTQLGAHVTVDPRAPDWVETVRAATDGRGVDLVFDPVGGEAFDAGIETLARGGRLLAVGYASGEWRDASTAKLVMRNVSVMGVFVGAYERDAMLEVHDATLGHWRAGRLPSLVGRVVGFDDVPTALGELAERRAVGKWIVDVAGAA